MMNGGTEGQAVKVGQIQQEMEGLEKTIKVLFDRTDSLIIRIGSITRQEPPLATTEKEKTTTMLCGFAERICCSRSQLEDLITKVSGVKDRIEL